MRPCISIRGSVRSYVRPSVGPSVHWSVLLSISPSIRNAFVSNARKRVISTSEVEGMSRGGRGEKGEVKGGGRGDERAGKGVTRGRSGHEVC